MEKRKWTKDEVEQWRREHHRIGYFNQQDSNIFISKGYGIGFTLNWGNPLSWILTAVIIAVIIAIKVIR